MKPNRNYKIVEKQHGIENWIIKNLVIVIVIEFKIVIDKLKHRKTVNLIGIYIE